MECLRGKDIKQSSSKAGTNLKSVNSHNRYSSMDRNYEDKERNMIPVRYVPYRELQYLGRETLDTVAFVGVVVNLALEFYQKTHERIDK